eukprot:scaffold7734_cov76-Phaeocystis_antarctica.AAC.2
MPTYGAWSDTFATNTQKQRATCGGLECQVTCTHEPAAHAHHGTVVRISFWAALTAVYGWREASIHVDLSCASGTKRVCPCGQPASLHRPLRPSTRVQKAAIAARPPQFHLCRCREQVRWHSDLVLTIPMVGRDNTPQRKHVRLKADHPRIASRDLTAAVLSYRMYLNQHTVWHFGDRRAAL